MVEVRLLDLCRIRDACAKLLPEEFAGMLADCERDPVNRLPFGVAADWLKEHREPELEAAFRWLFNRPEIEIEKRGEGTYCCWQINAPSRLGGTVWGHGGEGLIGAVVELADRLEELRKELT